MIRATAFEPDAGQPVWLLLLPEEWAGAWEGTVQARFEGRHDGLVALGTRHGTLAFPATAEAAVRARGARLVGAAAPPRLGPALIISWKG